MKYSLPSLRGLATSLLVLGSAYAFCQVGGSVSGSAVQQSTKHPAGKRITAAPKGQISTYSFFPAIDTSINQRGFRPRPGENKMSLPSGEPNNLRSGGITGAATNRMGAYFPGVSFTGLIPPDCHAATGLTHVVQTVNSRIAFYNKTTGTSTFNQDSSTFFSGMGAGTFQFDPRVIYDQYNDRFIMVFLAQDDAGELSQV